MKQFGKFEILAGPFEGGMSEVYFARDCETSREVALKLIKGKVDFVVQERFRYEAKAGAKLYHPNILPVLDYGEFEGRQFLTMPFVKGGDLRGRLPELRRNLRGALALLVKVARAIQYAHDNGVIHRDLKPANILIDDRGEPKVADFGIARQHDQTLVLTGTNEALGTPEYMAPEQARGESSKAGHPADIYSLGVILYEILTAQVPFRADTKLATLRLVENEPPLPPRTLNRQLDRDIETICLKCLEKDPRHRYGTASNLANDLDRWLRNEPILARPIRGLERLAKWSRRNPLIALLAGLLCATVLAGLYTILWQLREKENQRAQAVLERNHAEESLARMRMRTAEDYSAENPALALAYLARVLGDNLSNYEAAERLLAALSARQFILPRCEPLRHRAVVNSAQFSLDGTKVVTASDDGTAQVWSAKDGARVGEPLIHKAAVKWAQFSVDGRQVVTASADGTARVWVSDTSRAVGQPLLHSNTVNSAYFSPDGRWVATASDDFTARVWSASTGAPQTGSLEHHGPVHTARFDATGTLLVTASSDASAVIWNVSTGAMLHAPMKQANAVVTAEFSPDGEWVVAGAWWERTARVWEVASGQELPRSFDFSREGHTAAMRSAHFSPDGRLIVTAAMDGTVRVWNAKTGRLLRARLKTHESRGFRPIGGA